jgi:CRP-like cAMP-binding protein
MHTAPSLTTARYQANSGLGPFFAGVSAEQFECARTCLGMHLRSFERGESILMCTAGRTYYGVLESGVAFDVRHHANGERTLVDVIEPGDLFGEGWQAGRWACGNPPRERAVIGATAGTVLLLDPARLSDPTLTCPAKSVIQNNLLRGVLHKEERLRAKVEILRHRALRARIGAFLILESQRRGAHRFSLPLSRSELAEYLHADRAAVSRELTRMRDDGLIDFHRNAFSLLTLDETALNPTG